MVENFALIYLKNPNDKFAIGQDGALQITLVYDQTNDAYGLQLYFKDKDTWDFYHPSSEPPEEARQEGFVTTEKSEGQIIFAQNLHGYQGTVGQYLKELYLSAVQGVDLSQSYNPILSLRLRTLFIKDTFKCRQCLCRQQRHVSSSLAADGGVEHRKRPNCFCITIKCIRSGGI